MNTGIAEIWGKQNLIKNEILQGPTLHFYSVFSFQLHLAKFMSPCNTYTVRSALKTCHVWKLWMHTALTAVSKRNINWHSAPNWSINHIVISSLSYQFNCKIMAQILLCIWSLKKAVRWLLGEWTTAGACHCTHSLSHSHFRW